MEISFEDTSGARYILWNEMSLLFWKEKRGLESEQNYRTQKGSIILKEQADSIDGGTETVYLCKERNNSKIQSNTKGLPVE